MSTYNYQKAYQKASVTTMDQKKLVIMLYDGAIKSLTSAVENIRTGNIEKAHQRLVKSKGIVSELMMSLNTEKGGAIAENLKSLYNYMFAQLLEANIQKREEPAIVVLELLKELREAWATIGKTTPTSEPPAANPNQVKPINIQG